MLPETPDSRMWVDDRERKECALLA
jgi:hypothetical protein